MCDLRFYGWDSASLPAAVDILTQNWTGNGPLDLRNCWVVVPTRHAGRRLRSELAKRAATKDSAVLSGPIVTPEHLIPLPAGIADDSLILALLARRLLRHPPVALFPHATANAPWDFSIALGVAAQLQDVRRQLNNADRSAADVLPLVPDDEQARWQAIANLEDELGQELSQLGLQDPLQARRTAAHRPADLPPGARVIVLFVPDLPPLAARMLQSISAHHPVELHVLAPASERDRFDAWGRPLPDRWETEPLPLDERHIHVYEQAPDETEALATLLIEAEKKDRALAVCTPDPENARALARRLQAENLHLYLPNGVPLGATAPGRLLSAWLTFLRQRSCAATATFLRHPDAQDWLRHRLDLDDVRDLLSEFDQCQSTHLPAAFDDLVEFARGFTVLPRALDELAQHVNTPLASFLADIYDCRSSTPGIRPDPLFFEAANGLAALIQSVDESAHRLSLAAEDVLALLQAALPREQVFPRPDPAAPRETIGWLEVQWEDSATILLADMREGIVPETRVGDAFLPDSLRVRAGLPGNRDAFARDLFLTRALLAAHPSGGVRFLYSRRAANQDPQLPSRLLLACPDTELPARVALLFERPALRPARSAAAARPVLHVTPPICPPEKIPTRLRATDFSAYIACPFRFYLSRILNMQSEADNARELDPMGFGILAHDVLQYLEELSATDDIQAIQNQLLEQLDRQAQTQFGAHPPLAVVVQLDSLRQRLRAAANVHAQSVRDGWRIVSAEETLKGELNGMRLSARIDRIERHVDDGRIRILDYKTSDAGDAPLKTHYQPRNKVWVDLQLPLYRYLYLQTNPDAEVAVGYFTLPKAASDCRIAELDFQAKDGDLYPSAIETAQTVIAAIRAGCFWPPAQARSDYDDFALLFAGQPPLITEPQP